MQLTREDFLAKANEISKNTLLETLDIEMIDYGKDFLIARMPVNAKVHQPDGVHFRRRNHCGACRKRWEFCLIRFMDTIFMFVSLEITANHLKSVKEGYIYAKATFLHKGRTTQLLDIRITDDNDNLVSICRLTTISLPKKS
ncbi:MAG: hotdog fold thioesterase [Gelidibacter sp.]